ncbi:MAG: ATP-binding protein [Cyanobacteria bacterium P01_G01_bin.54]
MSKRWSPRFNRKGSGQLLLGLVVFSCTWNLSTAIAEAKKRVLVIHSYHDELPWTQGLRTGIDTAFQQDQQTGAVDLFHEFLDAKRYPNLPHGEAFLTQLRQKYQNNPPDLLIVSDDPGLKFILERRSTFFPELPIVFMGINKVDPALLEIPNMTGVFERHSTAETAVGALQQTGQNRLLVLNDSTETGQGNLGGIEDLRQHPDAPNEIIIINDITPEKIKAKFAQYSPKIPILVLGQLRQGSTDGPLVNFPETAQALREQLPNPLYVASVVFLGQGVIGGKILDAEHHAQQAIDLAQQILSGQAADQLPEITEAETVWIFDEQELKRFNFNSEQLPQDRQLINQKLSFYDQNKDLIWITISTCGAAGIIILLLLEILRRRNVQQKILKNYNQALATEVQVRTSELEQQKESLKATLLQLQKTQTQLIQTEKMSSLGQMVAGIAHEINNPTNFIFGNLQHLNDYTQSLIQLIDAYEQTYPTPLATVKIIQEEIDLGFLRDDLPKILASIQDGTYRIREIVRSLRSFSRLDESEYKEVDLHEGIESTLLILESRLKAQGNRPKIQLSKAYHCSTPINCYPGQLNQAIFNLMVNAIDVLEEDVISGRNPQPTVQIQTRLDNEQAIIAITDNGPGIPEDIRQKIFDPFFTTKAVGQGTGLGLSISYSIVVEQHGGTLVCHSQPGEGTQFIIGIPLKVN